MKGTKTQEEFLAALKREGLGREQGGSKWYLNQTGISRLAEHVAHEPQRVYNELGCISSLCGNL